MTLVFGIASMVFALGFLAIIINDLFKKSINVGAFSDMIQKLVIGGNPRRAIQLANSAPKARLTKAAKALLVVSQNPHRLYLTYKLEEDQLLAEASNRLFRTFQALGYCVIALCLLALTFDTANESELDKTLCLWAGSTLCVAETFAALRRNNIASERYALFRLMNLLFYMATTGNEIYANDAPMLLKAWRAEPKEFPPEEEPQPAEVDSLPNIAEPPTVVSTRVERPPAPDKPEIMEKL